VTEEEIAYSEAINRLIDWCNLNGWSIRIHNHPKTRANWNKRPHDKK